MSGQLKPPLNVKCRNTVYRRTQIVRFPVSDDKVLWEIPYDEYAPPDYNATVLKSAAWADADISDPNFKPNFNAIDGMVDRRSRQGVYRIVEGRPQNPTGRTGLRGRGCLGKWGPNHAADVIASRWKRNNSGQIEKHSHTGKPMLQFLAIIRRDSGEYAMPGGMVDTGETVIEAAKREFLEETLNYLTLPETNRTQAKELIDEAFKQATEVYRGYVDDPRNTDNAWMETVAFNIHDQGLDDVQFKAGSDATGVAWVTLESSQSFYASHAEILEKVAAKHSAHW